MKIKIFLLSIIIFYLPNVWLFALEKKVLKNDLWNTRQSNLFNRSTDTYKKLYYTGLYFFQKRDFFRAETEFIRLFYWSKKNQRINYIYESLLYLNRLQIIKGEYNEPLISYASELAIVNLLSYKGKIRKNFLEKWNSDLALVQFLNGFYRNSSQRFIQAGKIQNSYLKDIGNKEFPNGNYLEMAEAALRLEKFFKKSNSGYAVRKRKPWVSALLSAIVPGLGQIYNGQYRQGLLSFSTVGSFGFLSYYSLKNGRKVSGFLSMYLATVFYGHNIARTIESTWDYNQGIAQEQVKKYQWKITKFIEWWPKRT